MAGTTEKHPYEDIINLPHHVSPARPRMSMSDRAAQFSPFAALSGFEDAIHETARLTGRKIELDENAKAILDEKLRLLAETIEDHPRAAITYFLPDKKKSGGEYITAAGNVKKIDSAQREVVMLDGTRIPVDDILDIAGDLFKTFYQ